MAATSNLARKAFRFGYDIAISYSRADAVTYAEGLAAELTGKGFHCFLDQYGTRPDHRVPREVLKAIRGSSMLVVLGTPGAVASEAMKQEISQFAATGRKILPIEVGAHVERSAWFDLVAGLARTPESLEQLQSGLPSGPVIQRIVNAFEYKRRDQKLRAIFYATVALIAAAIAVGVSVVRYQTRLANDAIAKQTKSERDLLVSQGQLNDANTQANAAIAKRDAAQQSLQVLQGQLRDVDLEVQSRQRAAEAEEMISRQQYNAAQKAAVEAWRLKHTLVAQNAIVHAYSFPVVAMSVPGDTAYIETSTSAVVSAEFSRDGTRVVTANCVNNARVWDASSGKQLAELKVQEEARGCTRNAAFSPDGTRIVTSDGQDTVLVWDVKGGEPLAEMKGHSGYISTAVFSADGKHVLTAGTDGTARVWDAASGRQLAKMEGHAKGLYTAVFSRDGKKVVTASDDRTARVWDAASGTPLAKMDEHAENFRTAAFSRDGKKVITSDGFYSARVWDATSGEELAELKDRLAVFSPDEKQVVTYGSRGGTARVWDAASGEQLREIKENPLGIYTVALSPDGKQLVIGSWDAARVWDPATGRKLAELKGHTTQVKYAVFSPDGKRVLTINIDKAWIYEIVPFQDVEKIFSNERSPP